MASISVSAPPSSNQSGFTNELGLGKAQLLRVGEAAILLQVSIPTLKKMIREGRIEAVRLGGRDGSWWRIKTESIRNLIRDDSEGTTTKTGWALYCRKSNNDKVALNAQRELCLNYLKDKFGVNENEVLVFAECVSGVNCDLRVRKQLKLMLDSITQNRVSNVLIKTRSRLARFPGVYKLLEYLMVLFNVKLHIMFNEDDSTEDENKLDFSLIQDLLQAWCNLKSARLAGYARAKEFQPHTQERIKELMKTSSVRQILEVLKREGIHKALGRDGREKGEITHSMVNTFLRRFSTCDGKTGSAAKDAQIEKFARERLVVLSPRQKPKTPCHVIFKEYENYVRSLNQAPNNNCRFTQVLRGIYPEESRKIREWSPERHFYYVGLDLVPARRKSVK